MNQAAPISATGRRKCAVARVFLSPGTGQVTVNKRPLDQLYLGPLAPAGMAESLQLQKNPNVTVRMPEESEIVKSSTSIRMSRPSMPAVVLDVTCDAEPKN